MEAKQTLTIAEAIKIFEVVYAAWDDPDYLEYLREHPKRIIHSALHVKGNRFPMTCYWCAE